jgi:hypothetical protein
VKRLLILLVALALALVGCSRTKEQTDAELTATDSPKNEAPYSSEKDEGAAEASAWSTVRGRVVWAGDGIPSNEEIDVTVDKDHCLSRGKLYREKWVVNPKNKGVRWAFVWLVPPEEGGKLKVHPDLDMVGQKEVFMDQPCCKFEPPAVALRKGQVLIVKNSSPKIHNVMWTGIRQPGGNQSAAPGGKVVLGNVTPTLYGLDISCGIHSWMKAKVWMFDHPYFTLTDADGAFEIKLAPAGKCCLVVSHPESGWRTETGRNGEPIEVKTAATTELGDLPISPR